MNEAETRAEHIEIMERERKRVALFMQQINQHEKTLVFCANQAHALLVRDLMNQTKTSRAPNYCQRVTANDGELGEQHLRDFQDNEKTIPTVLTTSQKLSTGVDARDIRNIVLMRPINRIIDAEKSDLFDVLAYVAYALPPVTRTVSAASLAWSCSWVIVRGDSEPCASRPDTWSAAEHSSWVTC